MEIYRIKQGDSLFNISNKYKVPISDLVKANSLPYEDKLAVGMNLLIPSTKDNTFFYYTTKPRDFLYKISKYFNVDIYDIISLNNLKSPYILYPGQKIKIPTYKYQKPVETLIFFNPRANYQSFYNYISQIAFLLTYMAVFDVQVTKEGKLLNSIPKDLIDFLLSKNIKPLAVISNLDNNGFNSKLGKSALNNMDILINNILNLVKSQNYKGVMLDFENLAPYDRNLYSKFIRKLSFELHKIDKVLGVSLSPKSIDNINAPWTGFLDYKEIGKYVDIAFIMAYEWGWSGGEPQPVAPFSLVKNVMNYALNTIPKNKVYMGINLYGYDWKSPNNNGHIADTVTLKKAYKIAIDNNSKILWNEKAKTPYFRYYNSNNALHEVHFEDALSQYYSHTLAKDLNLKGIGYWSLNTQIAPTWYILNDMFKIKK